MKWGMTAVLLIVATASAVSVALVPIGNMMLPGGHRFDQLVLVTLVLIAALTVAALLLAFKFRPAASTRWLAAATALVVAVGLVPQLADWSWKAERAADVATRNRQYQAQFLADLETRKQDVEARVAARRPYTPEEAEAFVEFVRRSNLSYVSGPDHTAVAMPLLQQALQAKVFNPNAPVRNRFVGGAPPEPLFLQYYKTIRQVPEQSVLARDWNIMLLLVANGADLSAPGADALAADLRKTATPVHNGLYIDLK